MRTRSTLVLLIAVALMALLGWQLWSLRTFFQINHARFLMNQGQWKQASRVLGSIEAGDSRSSPARKLAARVALNSGDSTTALTILSSMPRDAGVEYERALAAYQCGDTSTALAEFGAVLRAEEGRQAVGQAADTAALAVAALTGDCSIDLGTPPSAPVPAMDQMVWNAMAGRVLFGRGDFAEGRRRLERALEMGDANQETMLIASAANAAQGDFPRARMWADQGPASPAVYESIWTLLRNVSEQFTSETVSTPQAARYADQRRRLVEAMLWVRLRQAEESGSTATLSTTLESAERLVAAKPSSLIPAVLLAEALEAAGRDRDAYVQYETLFERQPCFALLLRMKALAGDVPEIRRRMDQMLEDGTGAITHLAPDDLVTSDAYRRRDSLAFVSSSSATASFSTSISGFYQINIIARGDRAAGLSPLVAVSVDGGPPENIYIARDGWDCYPVTRFLTKGPHALSIAYINNSVRLSSGEEDRNFYLGGIIVSRTGVH